MLLSEIDRLLDVNPQFFNTPVDVNSSFSRYRLLRILQLAFLPKEVRLSETYSDDIDNKQVAFDWISGKSQFDILHYFKTNDIEKTMRLTFAYIHVQLMYYIPWALWSVSQLLDFKKSPQSFGMTLLPAFVKYGTTDRVAVYCSALGITSRSSAKNLGLTFRKSHKDINFNTVVEWLFSISFEELSIIIENRRLLEYTYKDILKGKAYLQQIK